jgi:hypothetical protein
VLAKLLPRPQAPCCSAQIWKLTIRPCKFRSMFVVSELDAAAIRAAFDQGGELSAAVELRRLFPGLANNENTRLCARTIAGWQPLPPLPLKRSSACRTRSSTP